jgi:hypothetical protein
MLLCLLLQKHADSLWPAPLREDFKSEDRPVMINSVDSHKWILKNNKFFVRCVTWNLCGLMPPPIEESCRVLFPGSRYHMYVIGSEECERTIAQSAINPSKKHWEEYLSHALGADYVPIRSHTLQAIHMMVFAHYTIARYIKCVASAAVSTGIGNTLGNKGGVGVYFIVGNTSFAFVNAHCAAHQNAVKQRNADCARICSELPKVLYRKSLPTVKYLSKRLGKVMDLLSDESILAKHDEGLGMDLGVSNHGARAGARGRARTNTSNTPAAISGNNDEVIGLAALEASSQQPVADSKEDESQAINVKGSGGGKSSQNAVDDNKGSKDDIDQNRQDTSSGSSAPIARISGRADAKSSSNNSSPVANNNSPVVNSNTLGVSSDLVLTAEEKHLEMLEHCEGLWDCADRVIFMGDLNYRIKGKRYIRNDSRLCFRCLLR